MNQSRLLRIGIEVEYIDCVRKLIYGGRPFWVSENSTLALAIPHSVRGRNSKKSSWQTFDHNSFEQRAKLFNFWPVNEELMTSFILPDAPPFFWHRLSGRTKTRVKFGDGYSYGESGSYIYHYGQNPRYLVLREPYAKFLPKPFLSLWEAANSRCTGVW